MRAAFNGCPYFLSAKRSIIMKRKLFATLIAVITVIACAFGFAACGGENGGNDEPSALSKAFAEYYKTQNMKVSVTDSRVQKDGYDYSATVELDFAHKAAHTELAGRIFNEYYYEISGTEDNPHFNIYSYCNAEPSGWSKINRDDISTDRDNLFGSVSEYEINLLCNWVADCMPPFALRDSGYREKAEDTGVRVTLEDFEIEGKFSQNGNEYTANVYFCIMGDTEYVTYACTATIELDAQGRFRSCVLDFGSNGKITSEFTYGTTNVTVPEAVKNAASGN